MRIFKLAALAAAISISGAAVAQTFELQSTEGDVIPSRLTAPKSAPVGNAEKQALHFAWALQADAELRQQQPFLAESREFWAQLNPSAAKRGFAFIPTAEGTLVRISRSGGARTGALTLADLALRVDGQSVEAAAAVRNLAGDAELKAAGALFSEGTVVFELAPSLVGKRVEVALPKSNESLLMHVLEPNSLYLMALKANRMQAQPGGWIELSAQFSEAGTSLRAERIGGLVTAPDGRSFEINFEIDKAGVGRARFEVPEQSEGGPLPWEVHAFGVVSSGQTQVLRDARTGFQLTQPSARLSGSIEAKRLDDGLAFAVPVQAAASGRFELRGTLYGSDAAGTLRPLAIAHTAEMLKSGSGMLELRFPAELLRAELGAPYALKDLNLSDQSRMSLSEQRQLALELPALPN
jgi:hypothetical protein